MELDYSLAIVLDSFFKKHNIKRKHQELNIFSKDELEKINELELNNISNLKDIDKLPNLKKLVIKSENFNNFASYIELERNPLLNKIKDFFEVEELSNLEELEIINDINIKKIDLEKLTNLKKLHLTNNPNLSVIKNLDKLKKLKEIIIYGTNVKNSFNVEEYIVNTNKTKPNILDINMYDSLIDKSSKNSKALTILYKLGFTNMKFAEKTGFADFALLSPDKVNQLYQKSYDFIKEKELHSLSDYEKIKEVYQFVIKSITFDNDGIIARDKQFLESNYNFDNIPIPYKNIFSMLHSSYNAGVLKKSNCEGYVNLMNFILRILDIDATSVHATDKGNSKVASYNHAISGVYLNEKWYYCEPTWEKPGEFKYFMKTYDEISETHILNPLELLKNKEVNFNVNDHERNHKY